MPVDRSVSVDENELLSRSLRNDREAFGALVERYASSIFSLAFHMVGEQADAEDVAQDTFVAAYKALPQFRADAKFSTWLYRIAVNKCKDWLRSRRGELEVVDPDAEGGDAAARMIEYRTPERLLSQQEVADHLERAIRALPPLYREAFMLKHVEGLSYEEMSEILRVNADTLKMRVYKARTKLCEELHEFRETV